jgi:hypothetical protein
MGKILETDVTMSMEPGADVDGWDGWMGASFDAVERYATRRKWHMEGMMKRATFSGRGSLVNLLREFVSDV